MLGTRPEVIGRAFEAARRRFPRHEWVGCRDGYFSRDEEDELLATLRAERIDLLLVGMGNPLQELWIDRCAAASRATACVGVGALLDFLAGEVGRAPAWVRRARLEWAWRLLLEPRRLWRRYPGRQRHLPVARLARAAMNHHHDATAASPSPSRGGLGWGWGKSSGFGSSAHEPHPPPGLPLEGRGAASSIPAIAAFAALAIAGGALSALAPWWLALGTFFAMAVGLAILASPYFGLMLTLALAAQAIPGAPIPALPLGGALVQPAELALLATLAAAAVHVLLDGRMPAASGERAGGFDLRFAALALFTFAALGLSFAASAYLMGQRDFAFPVLRNSCRWPCCRCCRACCRTGGASS